MYVSPRLISDYGDRPTQTYLYLTGQGGKNNGGLGSDLRTVGRQSSENAGGTSTTPESTAAPADLLAGYDWYNNDVARGEAPRLIQSSAHSAPIVDSQNPSAEGGQIKGTGAADATTVGMVNQPSGDVEKSRTVTNTGLRSADSVIRQSYRDGLNQDETWHGTSLPNSAPSLKTL